jgi:hypothetical protein
MHLNSHRVARGRGTIVPPNDWLPSIVSCQLTSVVPEESALCCECTIHDKTRGLTKSRGYVRYTDGVSGMLQCASGAPLCLSPPGARVFLETEYDSAMTYWLAMLVGCAYASVNEHGTLLARPIGIRTPIEGVLQNRDDVAIADGSPIEAYERLAIRRTRKMHLLGRDRQKHLASAGELPEMREHDTNGFLNPQVHPHRGSFHQPQLRAVALESGRCLDRIDKGRS